MRIYSPTRRRAKRDSRLLWFLAGIMRRISLFWFLTNVVGRFAYTKPDLLGPERREMILAHHSENNRRYAEMIGVDHGRYGYL